jgi:hypothetical protein
MSRDPDNEPELEDYASISEVFQDEDCVALEVLRAHGGTERIQLSSDEAVSLAHRLLSIVVGE